MRNVSQEKLIEFLAEPKTLAQIGRVTRSTVSSAIVNGFKLPEGFALFEQFSSTGERVFSVSKQQDVPVGRQWSLWRARNHQPYMWAQFPRNLQANRIQIVPLSDVHYGARAHNLKRFKQYIDWIAANDDVFTFLNGDIIENAIDGSVGGAIYESIMTPEEQIWGSEDKQHDGIINLLRPIAHKILWAQPGNHEWRTWKKTNIDPTRIVCGELKIPYFSEPVYADILAWGHRYTFFCHHGTTGSQTKGGKLNAAARPAEFQESVDFVVMGHVHDSMANPTTRIVRKRTLDANGRVINFALEERAQYVVICPSFHGYFGNYGARAGYAPGSWGGVNCSLFSDGTYRASE